MLGSWISLIPHERSRICSWTRLLSWRPSSIGLRCLQNLSFGVLTSWCHQHSSAKPTRLCTWVVIYASHIRASTKAFWLGEKCFFSAQQTPGSFRAGVSLPSPDTHAVLFHILVLPPDAAQLPPQGGDLLVWLPLSQSTWHPETLQRSGEVMGCRGAHQQPCPSLRPPGSPLSFVLTSASTDAPNSVLVWKTAPVVLLGLWGFSSAQSVFFVFCLWMLFIQKLIIWYICLDSVDRLLHWCNL